MKSEEYNRTAACETVMAARRNLCHVPPKAWEIDAATICGVCQVKNAALFKQAVVAAAFEPEPELQDLHRARPECSANLWCEMCGNIELTALKWKQGERWCSECRHYRRASARLKRAG